MTGQTTVADRQIPQDRDAMTSPTATMIGASANRFLSPVGQVVQSEVCGQVIRFTITNAIDVIQRSHLNGVFYEPDELAIIGQWFKPGSVFCDIGANIGNHSIFALKLLNASQSILFEPNPVAIEVLTSNMHLNGLSKLADMSFLGLGLSDTAASGLSIRARKRNIGAGRLTEGGGDIRTILGDEALFDRQVDFIKMDIEGMELRALAGLSATIARCRPMMFIEVDNANNAGFMDWVAASGYRVETSFQRYASNVNYLVGPA
ncbi:MAG: FkbM family methyltransferase [Rhodobacterales bacterium]|nr:FkbM family methyltransferase [Rhodobacterales bacterium]